MTYTIFDARVLNLQGIGRVTADLLTALMSLGDPSLTVRGVVRPAHTLLDGRLPTPVREGAIHVGARPFLPVEQVSMGRVARRYRPDVWHSPHFNIPYGIRQPLVLTVHDLFPLSHSGHSRSQLARGYYHLFFPLAIKRADAIVCVSPSTARSVRQMFPAVADRVRTILLGVNHEVFHPQPEAEIARVRLKYQLPAEYVLFVGSAKPHKNASLLARAWRPSLPPLVFVGLTAATAPWEHPPPGARLLGSVPDADLASLYSASTAVAVPSLYEGVGLPILEAMACGAPTVVSDRGGLPETAAGAARLADPTAPDAWTDALLDVSSDLKLAGKLREAGLVVARKRQWSEAARAHARMYQQLS